MSSPTLGRREGGQTTIFFAVLAAALLMTLGLAVEGGRMLVTYRQMQTAADMAALIGAQNLPNASQATADALNSAQDNGFDSSQTRVCVPPAVQSPYSAINYTASGNAPCSGSNDNYIEVQITDNLGTVPIFDVPVTLYAHAIARKGIPDIADYALVALDPGSVNGIKISGSNPIVTYGSVISNSTNSSSSSGAITTGSAMNAACAGLWYAVAAEPDPGKLESYPDGTVSLAPPGCSGGSGPTTTQEWISGAGAIADPYGTSIAPSASNMPNCSECTQPASNTWFYTWTGALGSCATGRTAGTWQTASTANQPKLQGGGGTNVTCAELFPGTYPNGITVGGGAIVYLNPGVYTLGNDLKITGGTICIYGAPACDVLNSVWTNGVIPGYNVNCASSSFAPSSNYVPQGTWYYYCSPWGYYDTSPPNPGNSRPAAISSVPTFSDGTTPLNGVTLYFSPAASGSSTSACSQSCSVNVQGNSGGIDLAFPNPCPGRGLGSIAGIGGTGGLADFPAGTPLSTVYRYLSTSLPEIDGSTPPSGTQIYPDADLTRNSGCTNPPLVWQGEFGANQPGEHLNFLVFAQNTSTGFSLSGSSAENWWGILHTFPCANVPCTREPTSGCSSCAISVLGSGGAQPGGPATVFGQMIADTEKFGGNSTVEVFNRPSGQDPGPGTSLVE